MKLRFAARLALKYIYNGNRRLPLTTMLAIVGMAIGVASLIVAMAVISGFETTLQKTMIDISGHMMVLKRGTADQGTALQEVKPLINGFRASTPFVFLEAVLADKGQVSGVGIEGVDLSQMSKVLMLEKRLKDGELKFDEHKGHPGVVVGQGIASQFDLSVGDVVRLVIPISKGLGGSDFQPKMRKFVVNGVVAFGHHEFDSRYIMMDLKQSQAFADIGDRFTGYKVRVDNDQEAINSAMRIANHAEGSFYVQDWRQGNRNLFEAVGIEKMIIFYVLLIIVVVACFNISGTLFISVVRRFKDISILKAMGGDSWFVLKVFTIQGLLIGAVGALLGVGLGLAACYGFLYIQEAYGVISSDVYKLEKIELNFRVMDFVMIFGASMLICFLATLAPALRGARLNPVEGMHYK